MPLIDVDAEISRLDKEIADPRYADSLTELMAAKIVLMQAGMYRAADAVQVVRCGDCYLGDTEGSLTPGLVYCDHFDQGVGPDFYCMCGKKRMDADAPERVGGSAE